MKTREEILEYKRQYRLKNKEKIKQYRQEYNLKNKKNSRKSNLKRYYNLTPEEYNVMYNNQKGCCAICGKHQDDIKGILQVDHNHKTGKIRGLLCGKCNYLLARYNENFDVILKAINYLNSNN